MPAAGRPYVFAGFRLPPDAVARIEEECSLRCHEGPGQPSKAQLIAGLADAEGLLSSAVMSIDGDVLAAAPRLRVISNFGVGFDNVDLAVATAGGIAVCNTPGVLSDAVADLTVALILSLARRLPEAQAFVREGRWQPGQSLGLGTDVSGKTLGIVGFGRIGRAVARRVRPFAVRVCFYDVFDDAGEDASYCFYQGLDELLRESDFVSLHVNLTGGTRHLIGSRELGLMKPSAYLINTARGPVVDQAALVEALREGRIAGAALDVLEQEPPEPDDPILGLSNAVVLPHIGSATRETRASMLDLAITNLLGVLRGETPPCIVNAEALAGGRKASG